jgi:hypothetical protein
MSIDSGTSTKYPLPGQWPLCSLQTFGNADIKACKRAIIIGKQVNQ